MALGYTIVRRDKWPGVYGEHKKWYVHMMQNYPAWKRNVIFLHDAACWTEIIYTKWNKPALKELRDSPRAQYLVKSNPCRQKAEWQLPENKQQLCNCFAWWTDFWKWRWQWFHGRQSNVTEALETVKRLSGGLRLRLTPATPGLWRLRKKDQASTSAQRDPNL